MPEFSGQIRHTNQNFPVLDLTDGDNQFNQTGKSPVKGMGVFSDIPSRTAITQRYRTKGYLAVVDSSAYVYTSDNVNDSSWEEEGNWAGLSAANGLPSGGGKNSVLVKSSGENYQAKWTPDPIFSSNTLKKADHPQLSFESSQDAKTPDATILGRIQASGVSSNGDNETAAGPRIDFTQVGDAGSTSVSGKIEFYTSSSSAGQQLALTISEEKTLIFAQHDSAPTPVAGGMYFRDNSFFLGVETTE